MLNADDQKHHFKMYKRGKVWVTIGIVALTWQIGGMTSQAATTRVTVPTVTPKTTDDAVPVKAKTTTLRTKTVKPKTDDQKTTQTGHSKTTADAQVKSDHSQVKVEAPKTENQAVKPISKPTSATNQAQSEPSTQPFKPTHNTIPTDQSVTQPVVVVKPAKVGSQPQLAINQSTKNSVVQPVAAPLGSTNDNNTNPTKPTPAKDYAAYNQTTNLDKGILGTSEWWIDAGDVLHIGGGQLADTHVWDDYDPNKAETDHNPANEKKASRRTGIKPRTQGISIWGNEATNINRIILEDTIKTSADASGLFYNLTSLSQIDHLSRLDTRQATNMAFMFAMDFSLAQLDLSHFQTANVTNMNGTFTGLSSLESLDLSSLNTGQVIDMTEMLAENASLTQLDLSTLDTHNVVKMSGLLMDDSSLERLNLTHLDTSNVTLMDEMFQGLDAIQDLDVSGLNTGKVVDMTAMFGRDDDAYPMDPEDPEESAPIENPMTLDLSNFDMRHLDYALGMLDLPLIEITLGKNSILTLDVPYYNEQHELIKQQTMALNTFAPNTEYEGQQYTGRWVNTKTHQVYTTAQLMALYTLKGERPVATYQQQKNLDVKDSVIKLGTPWQVADNFVSATNADGSAVSVNESLIKIKNQPNTQVLGKTLVTYEFTNSTGFLATSQAQVIVTGILLTETHKQLTVGTTWQPLSNVKLAVNSAGDVVTTTGVTATIFDANGQPVTNFHVPGQYHVTYQLKDDPTSLVTIPVTVVNLAAIEAKNSAIKLGTVWQPSDNFSAVDENGHTLAPTAPGVHLTGRPNTKVPGNYHVTYTYTDMTNHQASKEATVTVAGLLLKQDQANLITTANWQPQANLKLAVNADGKSLTAGEMQITAQPVTGHTTTTSLAQLTGPGTYVVTYQFTDQLGTHQAQTRVTVVSHAMIKAHDQLVAAGDSWHPKAGFVTATDEYGRPLAWSAITVTGRVDVDQAGQYPVTYSYVDAAGNLTRQTTTVTVLAASVPTQPTDNHHQGEQSKLRPQPAAEKPTIVKPITVKPVIVKATTVAAAKPAKISHTDQSVLKPLYQPASPVTLPKTDEAPTTAISIMGLVGLLMSSWLAGVAWLKRH
ncbi:bacterial Ig-like domain-containing protein [Lactiplantibacillus sp. WILCCON 0030]|uniref:Bacterial Ig-like domain-containing protein n=1 Tax=Lactiplantibacillus brownii TaxID=3069269 RepID=A0ABU1A5K6_9LACO|nr:bacterial Ig-like domain-containing protein [Lactiplantibacillus brownii]MDQ7936246.1 bacterial Ig-like domain-containing protein [Lactiplantibacillus brownii]